MRGVPHFRIEGTVPVRYYRSHFGRGFVFVSRLVPLSIPTRELLLFLVFQIRAVSCHHAFLVSDAAVAWYAAYSPHCRFFPVAWDYSPPTGTSIAHAPV